MADETDDPRDEPDRTSPGRGVSLAEEGSDDLPALLAIAVGIAVIAVLIVWSGFDPGSSPSDGGTVAGAESEGGDGSEGEGDEESSGEEPDEAAAPSVTAPDLAVLSASLDGAGLPAIELRAEGAVVTASGEVADEAQRGEVLTTLAAQPGVEEVIDELTVGSPAAAGLVTVEATQSAIVLTGTVADEAMAGALVERVAAVYAEDQIDNRLEIDPASASPYTVTINGSMTDPVLHSSVAAVFDGLEGVSAVEVGEFTLAESSDVEASLNGLEPIQFASGSSVILPESGVILDQAADFLTANPDIAIEIGGHTDSRGSDESNQSLSQARANEVKKALEARGVANTMDARGFGESRLKERPDDTLEAQQANRRIEFRIIG